MTTQPDSAILIQQWIEKDMELSKALVEIQESELSIEEQAEMAFHKISDMYGIPKLPEDIIDDDKFETSVYQELGILKHLHPENDLRGLVLMAIYLVKNCLQADDSEIDKTSLAGLGYRGENSEVELVLVQNGQSWVELGCKLFTRKI